MAVGRPAGAVERLLGLLKIVGRETLARDPPRKEPPRQAGIGKHRHLVGLVPGPRLDVLRPAQRDAARPPRVQDLLGQAEVGAAGRKGPQPVLRGVLVGLLDALVRPVGAAKGADAARLPVLVERLDDRPHRHARDRRGAAGTRPHSPSAARQRVVQVGGQVKGRHPLAVGVVVAALADDHHLLAVAPFGHPLPDAALAVPAGIDVRRVQRVAAQLEHGVQQRKTALRLLCRDDHGPQHQASDRLVDALYRSVLHAHSVSLINPTQRHTE